MFMQNAGKPLRRQDLTAALRASLEQRFPDALPGSGADHLPLADRELERVLGAALIAGRVARVAAGAGDGATTLALRLALGVRSAGHRVAFVDTSHTLAAPNWLSLAAGDGALFVRPPAASRAPWAAEVLARSGAFALVVLDVTLAPSGPSSAQLGRLRQAARDGAAAVLVLGGRTTRWVVAAQGLDAESGRYAVEVRDTARSLASVLVASALGWLAPRRVAASLPCPDRRPGAVRGRFDQGPGAPP